MGERRSFNEEGNENLKNKEMMLNPKHESPLSFDQYTIEKSIIFLIQLCKSSINKNKCNEIYKLLIKYVKPNSFQRTFIYDERSSIDNVVGK